MGKGEAAKGGLSCFLIQQETNDELESGRASSTLFFYFHTFFFPCLLLVLRLAVLRVASPPGLDALRSQVVPGETINSDSADTNLVLQGSPFDHFRSPRSSGRPPLEVHLQ